ncbi:MAG: glycosyltransferase family 4 protein [Candidatus Altiarchaeota archaeon]|nr:glycosyltransferase family 4 protein [Candidatus Altiarchaeota archaeon]
MKVLLVSEYWQPKVLGGGEISGGLLAKNLAAAGVDVSVLTSGFSGLEKYGIIDGVKVYRRLLTGKDPQSATDNLKRLILFSRSLERELQRLDMEQNFDIIHSLNVTSLAGVSNTRARVNKPMVAHINSPTPFCPRGLLMKGGRECRESLCDYPTFKACVARYGSVSRIKDRAYLKYNPFFTFVAYQNYLKKKEALQEFDFYMPISSFIKKLLIREGIREDLIEVVPNIVEMGRFLNVHAEGDEVPAILYLGPYSEYKGPKVLLEALAGLDIKYRCSLYGCGPLKDELMRFIKANDMNVSLNDAVPQEKVHEVYAKHDIVVFPSLVAEAFGRVAVEAMASGKPVIASRTGGVTDIVDDGITGLLVEPGDAAALANALRKLIKDRQLREEMGRQGRIIAGKKYGSEAVIKKVLGIYGRLAG